MNIKLKTKKITTVFSKEYYHEIYNKMQRTKLEICSIYEYIIRDKMFLEMISDKELITYFRECATISEDIAKNVLQMRQLSLSNRNLKEYKKGYQYNLLDINENFYESYNDEVESLYFEDAIDCYKTVNKELKKEKYQDLINTFKSDYILNDKEEILLSNLMIDFKDKIWTRAGDGDTEYIAFYSNASINENDYNKYKAIIDYTYERTKEIPQPIKVYGYPVIINDDLKTMALNNIGNFLPADNEIEITKENGITSDTSMDEATKNALDNWLSNENEYEKILEEKLSVSNKHLTWLREKSLEAGNLSIDLTTGVGQINQYLENMNKAYMEYISVHDCSSIVGDIISANNSYRIANQEQSKIVEQIKEVQERIKDAEQELKTNQETRKILSKENAYILQDLLTEPVNGLYGTAQYCKINGISVAAKTGTTNDNFDKWLCGFTPYYTAATWFGYDYNETINYNKKNPAGIIWANVMNNIHKNLNDKTFNRPYTIEQLNICIETGHLANTGCKNTYTEYFNSYIGSYMGFTFTKKSNEV